MIQDIVSTVLLSPRNCQKSQEINPDNLTKTSPLNAKCIVIIDTIHSFYIRTFFSKNSEAENGQNFKNILKA